MAFCNNCGEQIAEDARFCGSCGQPVAGDEAVDAQQDQQQPEFQDAQDNQETQDTQDQVFEAETAVEGQQNPQQTEAQQTEGQPPPEKAASGLQSQLNLDTLKTIVESTADETEAYDPADIEKNKNMGGLAYILFFLPLISCPDSKYARFHANQGLILAILGVAAELVVRLLAPLLTWRLAFITSLIRTVVRLVILALGVIGLLNGFSGKAKELPFIGTFRILK